MRTRATVTAIVAVTFVIWMGSRATAIALPLVALEQTGQTWTTGLVLGAESIPLLTVGWWGRRLRERLTTGRAVAVVMAVKVAGLSIVPIAAALGHVGLSTLAACGLIVGATSALDAPGVRALLSDLGDDLGPGRAARALTLQDLAHRCTMFLAPPLGALAVGHGHTLTLLWSECLAVAGGAVLMTLLPSPSPRTPTTVDTDRAAQTDGTGIAVRDQVDEAGRSVGMAHVLRSHPRMAASMAVHGVVSGTWFAFSLGLAVAGAQSRRPGELIAAGMTGYGLASTATSFAAPWLVGRIRPWPTAVLPAAVLGVCFVALPGQLASVPGIAVLAAAGGVMMPLGIGAHNRILASDPAPGPDRRAAFAADQMVDGGASAVGMLLGGAVIGVLGTPVTLTVTGIAQILAVAAALVVIPRWGG